MTTVKTQCSYCDRFTAKPHTIRIGKTASIICPRCILANERRYQQMTQESAR